VVLTNLTLMAITAILCLTIGWANFLLIMLPLTWLAGALGIWMFYIQHQYENVYWERDNAWDSSAQLCRAHLTTNFPTSPSGLPETLVFHHIHHLRPAHSQLFPREMPSTRRPSSRMPEIITLRASLRSLPCAYGMSSPANWSALRPSQDCCGCPVRFYPLLAQTQKN